MKYENLMIPRQGSESFAIIHSLIRAFHELIYHFNSHFLEQNLYRSVNAFADDIELLISEKNAMIEIQK